MNQSMIWPWICNCPFHWEKVLQVASIATQFLHYPYKLIHRIDQFDEHVVRVYVSDVQSNELDWN
jgi:hypothetical protein